MNMHRTIAIALALSALVLSGCSSDDQRAVADAHEQLEEAAAASSTETEEWERASIDGGGSIAVPPSMEIQSDEYRAWKEGITGTHTDTLILQQKGMNENRDEGFESYARILVAVDQGQSGDYGTLDEDIDAYSQDDIDAFDETYHDGMAAQFEGTAIELTKWYPLTLERVNGMSCMHVQYERSVDGGPDAMVNSYLFQDDDRMVTVTLSYRVENEADWKDDLEQALGTLEL